MERRERDIKLHSTWLAISVAASSLALVSCGSNEAPVAPAEVEQTEAEAAETASAFPASLSVIGDGYPESGNPCRRLGETEATVDLLDDSAVLVGCPTKESAGVLGGKMVGVIEGISLVSVPMDDANAGMARAPQPRAAANPVELRDIIRGKGGLEERCLAAVAKETGSRVIGTNRVEQSEAAIEIYVNVEGAQAPWRCLGYKDGKLGDVMFTGSEGDL